MGDNRQYFDRSQHTVYYLGSEWTRNNNGEFDESKGTEIHWNYLEGNERVHDAINTVLNVLRYREEEEDKKEDPNTNRRRLLADRTLRPIQRLKLLAEANAAEAR